MKRLAVLVLLFLAVSVPVLAQKSEKPIQYMRPPRMASGRMVSKDSLIVLYKQYKADSTKLSTTRFSAWLRKRGIR